MDIDIYDFDKTIVPFDSGSLFCGYCLLHYPYLILLLPFFIPILFIAVLLMLLHIISFTDFKKLCFLFVPFIPLDKAVKGFWDKHEKQVHKWFYNRNRYTVVISASPDFLLNEIHKRLDFDKLICTKHSRKTGAIIGENCRNEEKVKRLYEEFNPKDINVIDVYSDSLKHDKPIFFLAKGTCYHIVESEKKPFKFRDKYKD
ncbi:MAG: haloacid dehalogenase-like hydrolase [Clostridium sp.]|nr:haloacid dehalogenase-like hydrolase [Clostridium sp.]